VQNPPTLDFMFSRGVINRIRSGEWISPAQRTLNLFVLFVGWPLSVFIALSVISLRFDRFVLAALSVLILFGVASNVVGFVDDGRKWQGGVDINIGGIVQDRLDDKRQCLFLALCAPDLAPSVFNVRA
jgi:hypothetical protein